MKITVRLVRDHRLKNLNCWFEEKLTSGQWVQIPETVMSCEGNSRSRLADVIEKRRQQHLAIMRSYGDEQEIDLLNGEDA